MKMRIKYLGTQWHYKPEYDIEDFARVNCMEEYNPRIVLKLMKALYPLWLEENRPDYYDELD